MRHNLNLNKNAFALFSLVCVKFWKESSVLGYHCIALAGVTKRAHRDLQLQLTLKSVQQKSLLKASQGKGKTVEKECQLKIYSAYFPSYIWDLYLAMKKTEKFCYVIPKNSLRPLNGSLGGSMVAWNFPKNFSFWSQSNSQSSTWPFHLNWPPIES